MSDRIISCDLEEICEVVPSVNKNVPVITRLKTQDAEEPTELTFAQGWDGEYINLSFG